MGRPTRGWKTEEQGGAGLTPTLSCLGAAGAMETNMVCLEDLGKGKAPTPGKFYLS